MAASSTIRDAALRLAVEELGSHLATLESELGEGKFIELMRGDTVIAEVHAPKQVSPSLADPVDRPIPDFMGRMKAIWGDKPLDVDTTAMVREDRDSRG